ncbi:DNA topoisomerase IB [Cyclobacterium sp. 1_MG-2023]|uniref:DNA topoisomerase IB n=1 Tax=Cyclobacterium sp. 1_MG-2023 TaxID=3062681 RepID=UPI0026E1C2CD|nr:DNA topoisomerase IB [Cyclobacterium sp. 1_MG-2023]MDO6440398.1 DNA topoisomerase IB [Cyclobacterium sp. 1_MG-2023]
MKAIREIDDSALCIYRKKWARGFRYLNEDGKPIKDKQTLKRLKNLVIPPMWTDVKICRFEEGHIQATGRDKKGRKQYIYHSIYEQKCQLEKFNRLINFAKALPAIRKKSYRAIQSKEWTKEKVLGLMILILDGYGIRIGNKYYQENNDTTGLTTLRRKHMKIEGEGITFHYNGKSNIDRSVMIDDPELISLIKDAADLPGYEIFRYKDENGGFQSVDSDEVNEYLANNMCAEYSSKYFRTWAACRLAIEYYPKALEEKQKSTRKKFSNILVKMVASELGNTPSVCRNYYIHPAILEKIESKNLPQPNPFKESTSTNALSREEKLALQIIEMASDVSK